MKDYYSTKEAADILGVAPRTVQKHCNLLDKKKIGHDYILGEKDIQEIKKYMLEHPRGNPHNE